MKAIIFEEYGAPDVLRLVEIPKPTPADHEVLVKIYAAGVNPLDWHLMRGEPFLARLENGLRKPAVTRLGADLSGVVEAVGANVHQFRTGDAVFGDTFKTGLGAFAEYVCVPETNLVLKPDDLSFEAAAATPIAALTALQGLRDKGRIQAEQKVLINGASGGVGSFAVQIAKAFGTEVTAVCSTHNVGMVRALGANHVIDYTKTDFSNAGVKYDVIFDAVGNHSVLDLMRVLMPRGIAAIPGFTALPRLFEHLVLGPLLSAFTRQTIGAMGTVQSNKADLQTLREMLEKRQLVPVIDRCYPLSDVAEAIRYLETGRAKGKVIITVAS